MFKLSYRPVIFVTGTILAIALAFGSLYPGKALADSCAATDFECLYDAAVEYYEDLVASLNSTISSLQTSVTNLTSQLTAPKEIADNLAETITQADLGMLGIDPDAMDRYTEALKFIHDHNDKLLDEFEYFAAERDCNISPVCKDFRSRLAGLLHNVTEVTNQANQVVALQHQLEGQAPLPPLLLNSEGLAGFIANAPPALLFPLYYALDSAASAAQVSVPTQPNSASFLISDCVYDYCEFFNPLETMLDNTRTDLQRLRVKMEYVLGNMERYGPPRDPLCTMLFLEPAVPDEVAKYAAGTALVSEILAELGGWLAKPKVTLVPEQVEGGASFGAEVKFTVDIRAGARLGVAVRRLATPLKIIGQGIGERVSDCRQRLEQYLAICALENDVKKNSTFDECKKRVLFTAERFGF